MSGDNVYDCLVVGGGPAGSTTAWKLAGKGRDVLLLEKRQEIGVPVRCGEGISKQLLDLVGLERDPAWISSEMDGAIIHSPGGTSLALGPEIAGPEVGFVIRREAFDQLLARKAARAGAEVRVKSEVISLKRKDGIWEAVVRTVEGEKRVRSRIVVAADGFESGISRMAGIDTRIGPRDMDSCIQYEMVGVETEERFTEFFLGREKAPGGYIWCFPKGKDIANVGIGVNGSFMRDGGEPLRLLDRFISENDRFRNGTITEINAGGVSVSLPPDRTVADSFLAVGDAARMVDPLTGGGVYNGCFAAIQAADAIHDALERRDTSERGLETYERGWRAGLESEMVRNYLAKEKLLEMSDEILDKVIEAISGYDLSEISTEELLKAVGARYPEVLTDIIG